MDQHKNKHLENFQW